jgi:hypothetical protein
MMGPDQLALSIPIIAILCVTVLIMQRWKMKSQPPLPPAKLDEIAARLERIEQQIDAMAIETERISEAQRFTTKLLGDRTPARSGE